MVTQIHHKNITSLNFVKEQRKRVESNLGDVTSEQIGMCERVYDVQKHEWFYKVLSEQGLLNEYGGLVEYEVRWSRATGFTCTCKSGKYHFWNVSHPSKVCKHVRWSLAARREEVAASASIAITQTTEIIKETKHSNVLSESVTHQKQSIEEKWGLPAWMLRDPGKRLYGEYSH